jgi:hypothetical protein
MNISLITPRKDKATGKSNFFFKEREEYTKGMYEICGHKDIQAHSYT